MHGNVDDASRARARLKHQHEDEERERDRAQAGPESAGRMNNTEKRKLNTEAIHTRYKTIHTIQRRNDNGIIHHIFKHM